MTPRTPDGLSMPRAADEAANGEHDQGDHRQDDQQFQRTHTASIPHRAKAVESA